MISITTGDTLCDENHPVILESIQFSDPVISESIEPKSKADQEKMTAGLIKLSEEDPTFRFYTNHETGQSIIAGVGELHLDVMVTRLKDEFGVQVNVGAPEVAYRETISSQSILLLLSTHLITRSLFSPLTTRMKLGGCST